MNGNLLNFKTLIVATRNPGKVKEIRALLGMKGAEIRSLANYADSEMPHIVENGATFAENARIKAETIARYLRLPVLADDSGLCVDALGGAPGVYSARYAGEDATDRMNNDKLLASLKALPDRHQWEKTEIGADGRTFTLLSPARFVCSLILHIPEPEQSLVAEGACEGYITGDAAGDEGFGYDPLFYLPEWGLTMAQLGLERKNVVSHRGAALRKLLVQLS